MAFPKSTIVLITGANQGIGFETAKMLAKENAGYHIILGSRNVERGQAAADKLKAENLSVEAITIDVTSDESITAAAKEVGAQFGRLDVLINNAGIAIDNEFKPGDSYRELMFKTYNTNVFGAVQTTEAFIPLLEKSSHPRIVFVSSRLGSIGYDEAPGAYSVYRSTKSALNAFAVQYAHQFKERGWKINISCPGLVATNLNNYGGTGPVEDGAINISRLATLGKDGETGTFSQKEGPLPW
jgi:NAD(P)-dependent dehydrogenase (short-subunit alcohol dehydrogenase family)